MASMAESRMNLSALQQRDPYITGIVDTASQVALYSFNSNSSEWEKTDIEGTLFVYTRVASPVNGFLILNRLGLKDLIEPLNKSLEFQLQDPFLLYRNASHAIYGIWFYDKDECARIGQLMNSLVQIAIDATSDQSQKNDNTRRERRASESEVKLDPRATGNGQDRVTVMVESETVHIEHGAAPLHNPMTQPQIPQQPNTGGTGAANNVNIMDLLSRARDHYDKGEQRKSPGVATGNEPVPPKPQPPTASGQSNDIMHILNKARDENLKATKGATAKHRNSPARDSPKSKGKGKTQKKKGPKPMIDNPNASATRSTNILRPMPVKAQSSPAEMEDMVSVTSTSITLDALFKSTQDEKSEVKSASPQPPVMGMPPLLQRLMSQPGSSMLEDIERQSYATQTTPTVTDPPTSSVAHAIIGAAESQVSSSSNGASLPKMPSPPKFVSAKWNHEPDSPNTAIRRSLNIIPPSNGNSSSLIGGAVQGVGSISLSDSVSSQSAHGINTQAPKHGAISRTVSMPSAAHEEKLKQQQQNSTFGGGAGSCDLNVEMNKLRHMVIDDSNRENTTIMTSQSNNISRDQGKGKPGLSLNTNAIIEETRPELVTPQALLDKAALPNFFATNTQMGGEGVLLTPMAFETPTSLTSPASSGLLRCTVSGNSLDQMATSGAPERQRVSPEQPHVNALTRQQLQQALIHLLKSDGQFLTSIHEAYVQSLHQELRGKSDSS